MTGARFATRRYLALWFPLLPTDRLRIRSTSQGESPDAPAPAVLIEKIKGAPRIAAVDAHAIELGLTPGLTLADARARIPDLAARAHDPAADRLWLERLADGCRRYTPLVALDPPDTLILDIAGCAHLFGGERALAEDAVRRLGALGMTVRPARAATPEAAWALARHGCGQAEDADDESVAIMRLPIAALRLDPEAETGLRRAGLVTIEDVATRPLTGFAARFGARAAAMLRRLTGAAHAPIAPRRVLPAVLVERRFAEPIARTGDVLAVLDELLGEAIGVLEKRGKGGRRFEAELFRGDGLTRRLAIETSIPTRDAAMAGRLLRERIESLADPIDPGFGFDLVRLSVPRADRLAPAQLGLEGGRTGEAELAALIDRLSTRLGRARVTRLAPRDTHIPEQAQLALPAVAASGPIVWTMPAPGEPPLRPLHLFDPPQPIEVVAEAPDGPPHGFRWRRTRHEVVRYEGPERIAAEWWRRKDGKGLTRDYYRIEDARGRRFWVFRHGLYGEEAHPRWYLQGLFA